MIVPPDAKRFEWCFSTMGCPDLSLPEACALAAQFQIPRLELRSLSGTTDLPKLFAAQGWSPQAAREICGKHGVRFAVAGSSFKLVGATENDRAELARFCAWADTLEIPYVRVFGGGTWGTPPGEAGLHAAAGNVEWWRAEKKSRGWRIEMLLETHDAFSGSEPCLRLNKILREPVALIWDSHHTWRLAGERPAETWQRLGRWVRHVHFKDSLDQPSERHPYTYVLPGRGQMPLAEVIAILRANGFAGCVSLEWEKLWHDYLAPLGEALAALQSQPWFREPALSAATSPSPSPTFARAAGG